MLGHILGTFISLSVLASGLLSVIFIVNNLPQADSIMSVVVSLMFLPMGLTAFAVGSVGLVMTTAHFTD